MTTSVYDPQMSSALRQITTKGGLVTLTLVTPGTVAVATNTVTGGGTQTYTVPAIILPAKTSWDMTWEEASEIRQNQRLLYVAGLSLPGVREVPPQTVVTFAGVSWVVQPGSTAYNPDGGPQPILHTLQVKR